MENRYCKHQGLHRLTNRAICFFQLIVLILFAVPGYSNPGAELIAAKIQVQPQGSAQNQQNYLELSFSEPLTIPVKHFFIPELNSLVIDFPEVKGTKTEQHINFNQGGLVSLDVVPASNRTRIVVKFKQAAIYTIQQKAEQVVIAFSPGEEISQPKPTENEPKIDINSIPAQVNIPVSKNVQGTGNQSATNAKDVKTALPEEIKVVNRVRPDEKPNNISLNFQDIKVRAVLQLLAEFAGVNIVASDNVQGSVTLQLNNVPWDQALDIILNIRGLAKKQMDNVILVATVEDMARREKQELQAKQDYLDLEPLRSELIQINYANAEDIATLLKDKGNSLLSNRGSVSVYKRTNTIWLLDTSEKLREISRLIKQLDIPVKQVLIEARIVVIDKQYEEGLGVRFGISNDSKLSGTLAGANQIAGGTAPSGVTPLTQRLNVDMPATSATPGFKGGTIGVALARLGGNILLDLELSALEAQGAAEVISTPRLITANQTPAKIESGEDIPYQESTSSGATSIAFKKAVLSLEVTPQITPDGRIMLDLKVNQDTRGAPVSTVSGSPPAINTRNIKTQILVNNGQTIVLGGIYERKKNNKIQRIPLLGEIPVVGKLFSNSYVSDNRSELLIFITPKIVTQAGVIQ